MERRKLTFELPLATAESGLIAVLGVADPFPLAVAQMLAADIATIGGELADSGEAPDVAGLQHNSQCEDRADACHRLQEGIARSRPSLLPDGLLDLANLLRQALQDCQGTCDREHLFRERQQRRHHVGGELPELRQRDPSPGQSGEQALQTQDDGSVLTDELAPPAQEILEGPLGFRIDVAGGQEPSPQQVRQPPRVVTVIGVFEPTVLREGRHMDQMHAIARVHQTIHEPVPVLGRLDGDALKLGLVDREFREDHG